jgi:hypothetical protein
MSLGCSWGACFFQVVAERVQPVRYVDERRIVDAELHEPVLQVLAVLFQPGSPMDPRQGVLYAEPDDADANADEPASKGDGAADAE